MTKNKRPGKVKRLKCSKCHRIVNPRYIVHEYGVPRCQNSDDCYNFRSKRRDTLS